MSTLRRTLVLLIVSLIAPASFAVTYIVPADRDLVKRADGIVIATPLESHTELAEHGIVTVFTMAVKDSIKGSIAAGSTLRLVEPGGFFGDAATIIPGSPRYYEGKTYLVFLRQNNTQWGTYGLGLGQFEMTTDLRGRDFLARTSEQSIFGWNEGDWSPHVEKMRSAPEFLTFVRTVAQSDNAPARDDYFVDPSQVIRATFPQFKPQATRVITPNARIDYLMTGNIRWSNNATATIKYCCGATPQPNYDAVAALTAAINNWNNVGNLTHYMAGARDDAANGGLPGAGSGHADGIHAVLFNDPGNHLASFPGVAGLGGFSAASGSYSFGGESFVNPTEVDVIMTKSTNLSISQQYFTGVLTHELGHTLGFRHSNQLADNATSCSGSALPCTTNAIMNSTVPFNLGTLLQYDTDAVSTVYGTGPVCTNPSISVHPVDKTITTGQSTSLSVTAAGTSATYQWFQGPSGNVSTPIAGATTTSVTVSPTATTQYWVRVTACSQSVNSNAATVTVQSCGGTPPSGVTINPSATSITPGSQVTLTANVASGTQPFTFAWTANGAALGGGTSIVQTLQQNTNFQVTATNSCGSSLSPVLTINVTVNPPCSTSISSISASANPVLPGSAFTLTANATTTSGTLSYQWFKGALNNASGGVIGTSQTLNVSGQTVQSQTYWVRATSNCTTQASATSQITVTLNTGACGTNANQLCINGARYRLSLTAKDPNNTTGQGVALYQSNVFGYFSLPNFTGDAGNPEVFVKVVGPINGVPWIFYAGLTNLDYTVTVTDTQTGQTFNTYHIAPPPAGSTQNFGNFDVAGNVSSQCDPVTVTSGQTSASGTCTPSSSTLCLLNNRFALTLQASDNPSRCGTNCPASAGATVPVNNVFGFFTTPALSSDPNDIQAFVKMVDARSFSGTFWVFLGGLTDLRFTLTVTDTTNGKQKIYAKPAGSTCGLNDTAAFQ